MTLSDPTHPDDDEPEMEHLEPEAPAEEPAEETPAEEAVEGDGAREGDDAGNDGDDDDGEPLTSEELDQIETLMKGDPQSSETHTIEVTRLFTKVKKCKPTDPAHADLYKWYMRRLRGVARSLIYGNPDVVTEGGLNDEEGLLTEAYLHQAKLELYRVVKDAIRRKTRRSRLQRGRFQDGRQGRVNANQEIEGGEKESPRRWEWNREVERPKGIHRAILKYAARLPGVEPKYLGVYFRKVLGDPIEQIADDLNITTATVEDWANKAKQQILKLPREDS